MLKTFNDDMILTALQELTTEQTQLSARVQKLEANKNTTETYTGTLNNLSGTLSFIAIEKYGDDHAMLGLTQAFVDGDVSGSLEIDPSALGISATYKDPIFAKTNINGDTSKWGMWVQGVSSTQSNINDWASYDIGISNITSNSFYIRMQQGTTVTDITSYASAIPYTLTLYWHEM